MCRRGSVASGVKTESCRVGGLPPEAPPLADCLGCGLLVLSGDVVCESCWDRGWRPLAWELARARRAALREAEATLDWSI